MDKDDSTHLYTVYWKDSYKTKHQTDVSAWNIVEACVIAARLQKIPIYTQIYKVVKIED